MDEYSYIKTRDTEDKKKRLPPISTVFKAPKGKKLDSGGSIRQKQVPRK